jgi:hypothetical protein
MLARYRDDATPLFTYLEMNKHLAFKDATATVAELEATYHAKANHTGIQQLWFRGIHADGPVENITVDGFPPSQTVEFVTSS